MNPCTTRLSALRNARAGRIASVVAAVTLALAATAPQVLAQKQRNTQSTFNVIPISIRSVDVVNGALVATGAVGSNVFTAPINLSVIGQPAAPGACPVLDLSLGPIHLSLLGLNVDTSMICLKITAHQGGGLLGDLLCSIGQQLNLSMPLGDILNALDANQLTTLNVGLTNLLNQAVFTPLSSSNAYAAPNAATCNVLNLTLGPLDLTLLGLEVQLDNCHHGPITLDITATQGGGLLGNLLCSLAGNQNGVLGLLHDIADAIGQLVG